MKQIIDELMKIDTFSDLSISDLEALAGICTPVNYPPRSVIAREGFDADNLFALTTGNVGIWVDHDGDGADLLAVREAPCLVGEMSVADQLPRSATIVAGSPVAGYNIDATKFRSLLQVRGSIALCLMKGISRLVRVSNNSFVSELRERNQELETTNSELKETQKLLVRQERLSSLGKFSSMIIHDLRNPLSVINGYADMLQLKLDDSSTDLKKYVSSIKRESNRLTGLTGEWLDFSRGEIRLGYTAVSISELFDRILENVTGPLSSKSIGLKLIKDFDGTVMIDLERLQRVLINLIDNSRKACGRNGEIILSSSKNGELLVLAVSDNGSGMDEETLSHVFEPFYSTSDRGGTGLGMYIVKTVVEAHGGHVEIESRIGKGTKLTMEIPLRI